MAKFIAYVHTNRVGSTCEDDFEIPDEELEGLNEAERESLISDYARDAIANLYEWGWKSAEEGE